MFLSIMFRWHWKSKISVSVTIRREIQNSITSRSTALLVFFQHSPQKTDLAFAIIISISNGLLSPLQASDYFFPTHKNNSNTN